ncbi:MAG: hypothetical protein DRI65_10435 [Chloroflexota bacterium]|nr:MAG: hypothetical protein DRI65_10435 [Chloroflexota bacterium]
MSKDPRQDEYLHSFLVDVTIGSSQVLGDVLDIIAYDEYSFQIYWSGTPVGDFTIEQSLDGTNWETLTGSTLAAGGAAGSHIFEVSSARQMRFVRLYYTRTGSTGVVNGVANKSGFRHGFSQ